MRRTTAGAGLIGLAIALTAAQAAAIPRLFIAVDGVNAVDCTDQQAACDAIGTEGVVNFTGALGGGFAVNVTTGLTTPALPGIEMDLNSVNVQVEGGVHDLRIIFTETGFGDASSFLSEIGGVLTALDGSTITATSYFDDVNLIAGFGFGTGPFAASVTNPLELSGPYSLSLVVDLHTTGPATLSFDFNLVGTERAPIPEPASAALFAAGWLVVGAAVRRRA